MQIKERFMRKRLLGGIAMATLLAAPLLAQATDPQSGRDPATEAARGYAGVPSPKQAAVDASEQPITSALNGQAAAAASAQTATADAAAAMSAEQQAQYDADRASYVGALVKHDAAIDRSDARYARQQRAYADAMSVWRVQVAECKKGKQAACRMPPPNVSDYY